MINFNAPSRFGDHSIRKKLLQISRSNAHLRIEGASHAWKDGIFIRNLADLNGSASQAVDIRGASVTSTDRVGINVENDALNGVSSADQIISIDDAQIRGDVFGFLAQSISFCQLCP